MAKRSKYEQETIINYNQEEELASCFTFDPVLIRKMDKLCSNSSIVQVTKEGDGWREYIFPKKLVTIKFPRQISEEKRKELAERARKNFGVGNNG